MDVVPRGMTWLRMGEFELGWAEYEWRWKKRNLSSRPLYTPQWNGFSLANRRILLITEQGFGDTFQFIRYAPLAARRGAKVHVADLNAGAAGAVAREIGGGATDHAVDVSRPEEVEALPVPVDRVDDHPDRQPADPGERVDDRGADVHREEDDGQQRIR